MNVNLLKKLPSNISLKLPGEELRNEANIQYFGNPKQSLKPFKGPEFSKCIQGLYV